MSNQQEKAPIWGVAANILKERPYGPGGQIVKRGTRKFHGGAKVYMVGAFWGMGGEQIAVVGHFRGNGYVTSVIGVDTLENFRAEPIYSPAVINRILNRSYSVHHPQPARYNEPSSKEEAVETAANYARLAEAWRAERQKSRETHRLPASEAETTDDPKHHS